MATAASRLAAAPVPPATATGTRGYRLGHRDPREGGGRARRPDQGAGARPRGSPEPGGSLIPPCPPPPGRPRDWEREGEARPRPRPASSGLEAVLEWGWNPRRGQRGRLPPPHKHGHGPPPAGGGGGFKVGCAQLRCRTEGNAAQAGSCRPQTPALAPEEVTHLHRPALGAAPPLNLPPSPALARRRYHACGGAST